MIEFIVAVVLAALLFFVIPRPLAGIMTGIFFTLAMFDLFLTLQNPILAGLAIGVAVFLIGGLILTHR